MKYYHKYSNYDLILERLSLKLIFKDLIIKNEDFEQF